MRVTIEVELSEREYTYLCHHSIERAINLAIDVAWMSKHRDRLTAHDDLRDIKPIATRLWTAAHNAVFAQLNPEQGGCDV